jgi:hypothetical protein
MQGVSSVVPCLSDDCAFDSLRKLDGVVVIHSDRVSRPKVTVCAVFLYWVHCIVDGDSLQLMFVSIQSLSE